MTLQRAHRIRTMLWHLRHGGTSAIQTWRRRERIELGLGTVKDTRGAEGAWSGRKRSRNLMFADAVLPEGKPRRAVRAAVILDEFSSLAFSYEWETIVLTPGNWGRLVAEGNIDLLFVESAWNGNSGSWKYQLTGPSAPSAAVLDMVEAFRAQEIPTVFWAKEDPPHYDDFLAAARLFDYVFTSDSNMMDSYRRDLGHDRVAALAFAAQPVIHNPVRPRYGWHQRDVAFAGMYFAHKFAERREQMNLLLGAAAAASSSMNIGLEIFSRQLGKEKTYQFPPHLVPYVVGSLPYRHMLTAYKAYKVFLNVNSVVASPSMCARRVFEITASGTPVVSTRSMAIDALFPPAEIPVVESSDQARSVILSLVHQPSLGERQVHLAQRRIWQQHTYAHRAEQVLAVAAPTLSRPVALPTVTVMVSTIRPHQLEHVFRMVNSQREISAELILLTHGFTLSPDHLAELRSNYPIGAVTVLEAPREQSLGECLNACVAAASGTILTKMDDDDYYGPHYLLDQLHALNYSSAEVVGKQAHYMYLQTYDATVLRFPHKEHRFTNLVMGPTIMAARSVFLDFPFERRSRGEDTAFLGAVTAASGALYSSDKFNYYQQRNGTGHTWQVSDQEILATAGITFYGKPDHHVSI
ncbi:spore maturation protein CgeB [Arthrobacter sp. CAN_A6]|uniref:glycosyltransferase family protein n=1 Tax=Arthrobacter sp. CAN_A6 TaxID=2787721 RepID=UPI0018C8FBC6